MLDEIIEDSSIRMQKALAALDNVFKSIRTGRANPALLESIKVDYYGTSSTSIPSPTSIRKKELTSAFDSIKSSSTDLL